MSNDEVIFEDETSDDEMSDDLFDDEPVDEEALLDDEADDDLETDDTLDTDDTAEDGDEVEEGETTEALDDLEAEELEMLTEDEASETIVVDEEAQLRDIRRAQLAMETGVAGAATESEFVCSVCFLVKRSSQLSSKRKKICRDCAG